MVQGRAVNGNDPNYVEWGIHASRRRKAPISPDYAGEGQPTDGYVI